MILFAEHERQNQNFICKDYALFLDDCRVPQNVKWIDLPFHNWVVVRNYDEFVRCITKYGCPSVCTFDHDLADEHYTEYAVAHDKKMVSCGTFRYDKVKEKTGYHCAEWLANFCVDKSIPIPVYYTHTMNGIGQKNIVSVLESARKVLNAEV